MDRRYLVIPLLCGITACADRTLTTEPTIAGPRFEIADAARAYKSGFYWLPPVVEDPVYAGTFDAELSPTVEICELVSGACGTVIATYTTTSGPGGELVQLRLDDEHYAVKWHTNEFEINTSQLYRISVRAGIQDVLLGFADVEPVDKGSGLRNIDTDEYIGLIDGRTLLIKFRIETGIVGEVEVQPVAAEAEPGATQQFVAILRDLHGSVMMDDVSWASSDETVATVDQAGLATAVADGVATITATSERVIGSSALTVTASVLMVSGTCALDADGRAFCWGGLTGNESSPSSLTPVPVSGGLTFSMINQGVSATCGVTTTNSAYCWGLNSEGRLGDGTTTFRPLPTAVLGGHSFVSISLGLWHACAITDKGQAYCWGEGFDGQLGNGSQANRLTPTAVSGGHNFTAITTGLFFSCGLTTTGQAYCWGQGGMLGNGASLNRLTPTAVLGGHVFASIDAGQTHACAIAVEGQAYCWGSGARGKLGDGASSNSLTPVAVTGGHAFTQVSGGGLHTCGVTTAGQAYCWGGGFFGVLGNGSEADQALPTAVAGGILFRSIDATSGQTCAVSVGGQIYCWGIGSLLGNGSRENRATPVPVAEFP